TTQLYRRALDRVLEGRTKDILTREERRDLEQVYSRGGSAGFLEGTNHQTILDGTFPAHRGLKIGTVAGIDAARNCVLVALDETAQAGDGIMFTAPTIDPEDEHRPAGRVTSVRSAGGTGAFLELER